MNPYLVRLFDASAMFIVTSFFWMAWRGRYAMRAIDEVRNVNRGLSIQVNDIHSNVIGIQDRLDAIYAGDDVFNDDPDDLEPHEDDDEPRERPEGRATPDPSARPPDRFPTDPVLLAGDGFGN